MTKIRAIMIVKEYFTDLTIDQAECLLWKQTGWPCFWPSKEKTVEENL